MTNHKTVQYKKQVNENMAKKAGSYRTKFKYTWRGNISVVGRHIASDPSSGNWKRVIKFN